MITNDILFVIYYIKILYKFCDNNWIVITYEIYIGGLYINYFLKKVLTQKTYDNIIKKTIWKFYEKESSMI